MSGGEARASPWNLAGWRDLHCEAGDLWQMAGLAVGFCCDRSTAGYNKHWALGIQKHPPFQFVHHWGTVVTIVAKTSSQEREFSGWDRVPFAPHFDPPRSIEAAR